MERRDAKMDIIRELQEAIKNQTIRVNELRYARRCAREDAEEAYNSNCSDRFYSEVVDECDHIEQEFLDAQKLLKNLQNKLDLQYKSLKIE